MSIFIVDKSKCKKDAFCAEECRGLLIQLPENGFPLNRIRNLSEAGRHGLAKLVLAGVMAFLLCAYPVALWAHAFPDHSDPKVGATVKSSPHSVKIWFDGDLEPVFSKLVVRDEDNRRVDNDDCKVAPADPKLLEVGVPQLQAGQYRVMWSVVARDGHRTYGDFTFKVK